MDLSSMHDQLMRGWATSAVSVSREVLHPSENLCDPTLDLLKQFHILPVLGAPEMDWILPEQSRGAESSPHLLPTLFWMQPRTYLASWAASAHGQVMLSSSSTNVQCQHESHYPTGWSWRYSLKIQQLEEADEITWALAMLLCEDWFCRVLLSQGTRDATCNFMHISILKEKLSFKNMCIRNFSTSACVESVESTL